LITSFKRSRARLIFAKISSHVALQTERLGVKSRFKAASRNPPCEHRDYSRGASPAAVAELCRQELKTRSMKKRHIRNRNRWILIIINALFLFTSIMALNNSAAQELWAKSPIPIPLHMLYGGITIQIVCAIFMLQGANWAAPLHRLGRRRVARSSFSPLPSSLC
jgi:hypothetical protein